MPPLFLKISGYSPLFGIKRKNALCLQKKILTPIILGATYHIFNRGVNYANVFNRKSDYQLFLEKLKFYVNPVADIFAYTLIPNHYHLLLRVKESTEIGEFSHQFKRFILSYTNLINKQENRSGNLFLSVFKRLRVQDDDYSKHLMFYLHFRCIKQCYQMRLPY